MRCGEAFPDGRGEAMCRPEDSASEQGHGEYEHPVAQVGEESQEQRPWQVPQAWHANQCAEERGGARAGAPAWGGRPGGQDRDQAPEVSGSMRIRRCGLSSGRRWARARRAAVRTWSAVASSTARSKSRYFVTKSRPSSGSGLPAEEVGDAAGDLVQAGAEEVAVRVQQQDHPQRPLRGYRACRSNCGVEPPW